MVADMQRHLVYALIALQLISGVFGRIVNPPENTFIVPTDETRAHLRCTSDTEDEISWTYDGNTIISAPCQETGPASAVIFSSYPKTTPSTECNVNASLEQARNDDIIKTISGPYGCTDRTNDGVTETAMVIVLEPWCGLISGCPIQEGDDVTIGCGARYNWLTFLVQYNPVVTLNSSVEFMEAPETFMSRVPNLPDASPSGPSPEEMMTTYTIPSVTAGQQLEYTCKVQFKFTGRGYSARNDYANNTLTWSACTVRETVSYCPRGTAISPSNACQAGLTLTCSTNSHPASSFRWIDNLSGVAVSNSATYVLPEGPYDLTCVAYLNANCMNGYYSPPPFADSGTTEGFPFDSGMLTRADNATLECEHSTTVTGVAIECPTMTLQASIGNECSDNGEILLTQSSTVEFTCSYESARLTGAVYSWSVNGSLQPGRTSDTVPIRIQSGSVFVTCEAYLPTGGDCNCTNNQTLKVSVIECMDQSVMISPSTSCVPEDTTFSCTATSGHPSPPEYYWTQLDTGMTFNGSSYAPSGIGLHNLRCTANYTHDACPQYWAACHSDITVRTFTCPNMSLSCLEGTMCHNGDIIVYGASTLSFNCSYGNYPNITTYTWYMDNVQLPASQFNSHSVSINVSSGVHTVKCEAMIDEGPDCKCEANESISVSTVDCQPPTIQPSDACVLKGRELTCEGTVGNPGNPMYTLHYSSEAGNSAVLEGQSSYQVDESGNFSLVCVANYAHQVCTEHQVPCYANYTGTAIEACSDNLTISHNTSSVSASWLFFNETISLSFECHYQVADAVQISYTWYVNDVDMNQRSKDFVYFFDEGSYTVTCESSYPRSHCEPCSEKTSISVIVDVPPRPCCPFPHWPPILPPIIAVILSILMIPCYCYSCGPWSGPYWAEERRKLLARNEPPITQTSCPVTPNGYNSAARLRPKPYCGVPMASRSCGANQYCGVPMTSCKKIC